MKSHVRRTSKTGAASGYLARRNPTAKLGLLFATSLTSLFIFDPITPTVLYVLSLAVVMGLTDIGPRSLALAHIPFVSFAAGLLVVNAVSRPGTVLWEAGFLDVTDGGLSVGTALAMRTLVIGVLSIGFLVSTDAVALMTSLHHNARLSPRLTYALLAGYRMRRRCHRNGSRSATLTPSVASCVVRSERCRGCIALLGQRSLCLCSRSSRVSGSHSRWSHGAWGSHLEARGG